MITVSIVTITFNAGKVLRPTLDSVLAQQYADIEHVIIDGASTDDTMSVAEEYARQTAEADNGHVVVTVSEPDNGLYDAMNKGLRMVTGQYVCFLNAGDLLPAPDTIGKVVEAALRDDGSLPAVVYGDTDIVDGNWQFLHHRRLSPPDNLSWRSFRKGMLVCHQAFYARCDIAKATPYDLHYRYSADVDWCIRVMREAERQGAALRRVEGVVALYMEEGQTTEHHKASLRERFDVMRRHYGLFSTLAMHAWFVWRGIFKKGREK
ncbi:MAG: glycosyltransferase [Prevotella sp.]|nr:glycosyltransferase [Prevotella sp.]